MPVACVPTGIKHLHHKALEYDIGVYFEANGHGTVVFSENAKHRLKEALLDSKYNEQQKIAIEKLKSLIDVINEAVGDAIADMLLVETILHIKGWNVSDWEAAYTDLPNRLYKITVKVRKKISFRITISCIKFLTWTLSKGTQHKLRVSCILCS